jgi:flavin reductase (DIM6/NTAB) family NADH-FMN oxidoreductase RutF
MFFDFGELSDTERYKLLTSTVTPRPIALVVTQDVAGRRNAAPFSWFNMVAISPPLLCFGISFDQPGSAKDTGNNIRATGQFTVNLVPHRIAERMNVAAIEFGPEVDEISEAGFRIKPSRFVAPPCIADSPVSFECQRYVALGVGEKAEVVLGRVLAMHCDDDVVLDPERCHVDTPRLDLIGRMHGGGWYATSRDHFELPRISPNEWAERGNR